MERPKCWQCYRRETCSLFQFAKLSLPWIKEARRSGGNEWETAHHVRRALRGCGACPGYVDDWQMAGAMTAEDVTVLVEAIIKTRNVDLALLCKPCRSYLGPAAVGKVASPVQHWAST